MDLRILGPFEVYDDEGRLVELGGRQQRLVLAVLLLNRDHVVSVDRLIDAVWVERPPANAARNVQVHISRLRKALESPGTNRIRTLASGYLLEVRPGELDADRFERRVEESRRMAAAGELERAHTELQEALALWRGAPLSDFAYESFAESEIARLEELRLGALEDVIDVELALGRASEAIAPAQTLVADNPLRERPRGQLMLALYRSGRKAEALRLYEQTRRSLVEELGIEPGASLKAFHRAMLTDDPSLSSPRETSPRVPPNGATARSLTRRRDALLALGGALLLGAAITVATFELTRDRASAGLASVAPDSLAAIDPATNRVVAEIPVGARPAAVVSARHSLWVANLDDEAVQRIDPTERRVLRTISTASSVTGLASSRAAIWAIAGERGGVLRIDPTFNDVVDRIGTVKVGTLLTAAPATGAIAASGNRIWAVSGGFFATPRIYRIDAAAKRAVALVSTGNAPTAIAAGFGDLWVTDGFENTIARVDPAGVVLATIPVGSGANAVAVGAGAVWVVDSLDDAIARIDPATNAVTTTIPVGRYPTSVAVGAGAVWVGNSHDGTVSRIDPSRNVVVRTIELGTAPAGLAISGGSVWVTSQRLAPLPTSDSPTEGTAHFTASQPLETDPARYPERQINYATCAKLLNYPDAPAPGGTRLVPEVAESLPEVSADGRTYTFTVRGGFAFSPPLHERVTAATFKYSIERSLSPKIGIAAAYVHDIAGQAAYEAGKARHISGVVARGNKLVITLTAAAPDFLARIATSFFCAVPRHTPFDPKGIPNIPSAGPYYIAAYEPNRRIVLDRNPNYHGSRPHRLRRIEYTLGVSPAQGVADVEAGRSDYVVDGIIPADRRLDARLLARYGPASAAARSGRQRYFLSPTLSLAFLALNTSRPLFADPRWRRAVNYALDRRALARAGNLITGPFPAIPTDGYLPPAMPGVRRAVLFPPAGNLSMARKIAPARGGVAVVYTCNLPLCRQQAQIIRSGLAAIGLGVEVREFAVDELFERVGTEREPFDIVTAHWGADYADPSDFLNVLLDQRIGPHGNLNLSYYRNSKLARSLDRVSLLVGEARDRGYAELAIDVARKDAPWVAYATGTSRDLFSGRMGCQVIQPFYGIDLGALCIGSEGG